MQETEISNSSHNFRRFTSKTALAITLAMAAATITTTPAAHAGGKSGNNSDGPANLVSHVALTGGNATRMLLAERNGKE